MVEKKKATKKMVEKPAEKPTVKLGEYLVLKTLTDHSSGIFKIYKPGDKIILTNEQQVIRLKGLGNIK